MKRTVALLAASLVLAAVSTAWAAGTLHFVIMSPVDPRKEGLKYEALSAYLRGANPLLGDIKLRIAKNYPEAVRLFAEGGVEGMFSGSFVASVSRVRSSFPRSTRAWSRSDPTPESTRTTRSSCRPRRSRSTAP